MLPFVRPALAAALHVGLALALLAANPPRSAFAWRVWTLATLVALVVGGVAAYTSGWVVRTRSALEALVRGAFVGFGSAVNLCAVGFALTKTAQHRLGVLVLAFGLTLAGGGLVTGPLAAWLHRRWSR